MEDRTMVRHTDSKQPLRSGQVLRDSYRIDRVLGSGGFAVTYLACHNGLHHQVAIKEYLPTDAAMRAADGEAVLALPGETSTFETGLAQFTDEARTLASFRHRSIVAVSDIFRCNGTAYMTLEHVDGESLAARLDRADSVDEAMLLSILDPILEALEELHRHGVLHRDIKPANILLRGNGCPVLIDFGNARSIEGQTDKELPVTLTPGYAPIEQYMATGQEGPWTDIYALGATLYRAVTGITPPDAKERVIADQYIPVRKAAIGRYSAGLLLAIDRALSMRPDSRPQSIDELRSVLDFQPAAGSTIVPAGRTPDAPSIAIDHRSPDRGRFGSRFAFAAALFAAMTAGTAYLDWSDRRQAEAVKVAAAARMATERARRESAQRREVARWEREAEIAAERIARRRATELARRRAVEAERREAQEAERRRLHAAERRRAADTARKQAERARQRRLADRRADNDKNPLKVLRNLLLGALPR
jgi:serine/threonine protein kinase